MTTRYAFGTVPGTVDDATRIIERYLPANYWIHDVWVNPASDTPAASIIIGGHDSMGWTLDEYVIPRLASGLHWFAEISDEERLASDRERDDIEADADSGDYFPDDTIDWQER